MMGRQGRSSKTLQAILMVVTLINCLKVSPSYGEGEQEMTEVDARKLKCLAQKIMTCGISDDKTPCKERSDEVRHVLFITQYTPEALKNTFAMDFKAAEDRKKSLIKFIPDAKNMCSMALGLHCVDQKCALHCKGDNYRKEVEDIVSTADWNEDYKCSDFDSSSDYVKCPLTAKPAPLKSTEDDMKALKCAYKKIVTCGITDNKICTNFQSGVSRILTPRIAGFSLQEMLANEKYKMKCDAEDELQQLKDWARTGARFMCSLAQGFDCDSKRCKDCKPNGCNNEIKKIAGASDWKEDFDCGETAKCEDNSKFDENPSVDDLKKIKCLYKKIVTCGITDDKTECTKHSEYFGQMVTNISRRSVEQLEQFHYPTDNHTKEAIKWLEVLASDTGTICSAAKRLYCMEGRCKDRCIGDNSDPYYCDNVDKIFFAEDWKKDFDCGDTANCPKDEMTTVVNDNSGTGRIEVSGYCRALAAVTFLLSTIPVLAPY